MHVWCGVACICYISKIRARSVRYTYWDGGATHNGGARFVYDNLGVPALGQALTARDYCPKPLLAFRGH
jgi:hypothetical protein